MDIQVTTIGMQNIIEGAPGRPLLQSSEDAAEVVGACLEHHARSVLLYGENLTRRFFDLSSGEAGAILQKFGNYRMRLAVVVSADRVQQSSMFHQMAAEESRGDSFRLFADAASARAWLAAAGADTGPNRGAGGF